MAKLSQYMRTFILLLIFQIYIGVLAGMCAVSGEFFPIFFIALPMWGLQTIIGLEILSFLYSFEHPKLKKEEIRRYRYQWGSYEDWMAFNPGSIHEECINIKNGCFQASFEGIHWCEAETAEEARRMAVEDYCEEYPGHSIPWDID